MADNPVFFIIIALLVVGAGWFFSSLFAKEVDKAWRSAAEALELRFQKSPTRAMVGTYEGIEVSVETVTHYASQGGRHHETQYEVDYPSLNLGLELTREGLFSGIEKALGTQDIEIGERGFDDQFMIKGSNPEAVKRFLTPSRRMRIERLFTSAKGSVTIEDSRITVVRQGLDSEAAKVVSTIHVMVRLAKHLIEDRDDDRSLDEAISLQEDGDLQAALERLREITGDSIEAELSRFGVPTPLGLDPDKLPSFHAPGSKESTTNLPVEELVMEGEMLYLAGDYAKAARIFERAHWISPFDEEILGWHKLAREKLFGEGSQAAGATGAQEPGHPLGVAPVSAAATDDPPESVPEAPEAPTTPRDEEELAGAEDGPTPAVLCEALFAPNKSGLEIRKTFEKEYDGLVVRWEGLLRKTETYTFDLVFGREPGTKIVADIHNLASVSLGDSTVRAIVQLPEGACEALEAGKGERIRFEGRLVQADGLMRNLYVAAGRLIQ